jgi:hypothetical protein
MASEGCYQTPSLHVFYGEWLKEKTGSKLLMLAVQSFGEVDEYGNRS